MTEAILLCCDLQAAPANEEVLEMLADYLPSRFPDRFSLDGSLMHNHARNETLDLAEPGRHPLELASLLVQVGMTCNLELLLLLICRTHPAKVLWNATMCADCQWRSPTR